MDEPEDGVQSAGETPQGFSTAEKMLGIGAAYKHPLASSLAASALLKNETDPTRRRQLGSLRRGALIWFGVTAAIAVVVLVIILSAVSSHSTSGACQGHRDRFDAMNTTYQSAGNGHWTATYPCTGGGSTTVPVARREVPGLGHHR